MIRRTAETAGAQKGAAPTTTAALLGTVRKGGLSPAVLGAATALGARFARRTDKRRPALPCTSSGISLDDKKKAGVGTRDTRCCVCRATTAVLYWPFRVTVRRGLRARPSRRPRAAAGGRTGMCAAAADPAPHEGCQPRPSAPVQAQAACANARTQRLSQAQPPPKRKPVGRKGVRARTDGG